MSQKLMLLMAGALMALAFTSLAGTAAATETKLNCEGTKENATLTPCTFKVAGGESRFSLAGGDTVWCSEVEGNGEVSGITTSVRESTTSTVQLLFKDCTEQNTIFHFKCSNTATAGNITTNVMTSHNIKTKNELTAKEIEEKRTKAGVVLTNAGVTFTCAGGFASTQVTGSIIGESESECGTNTGTVQKQTFGTPAETPHGSERLKVESTGKTFDLEGKTSHTGGGTYETAAQTGTGTLTFNQNVLLTCA